MINLFFESSINYVIDTVDASQKDQYRTNFNEKVIRNKNTFTVAENIDDVKLYYEETPTLKWELLNETKKTPENNTIQLAKTKSFGRVWYAWFSPDIPINVGTYKFRDLPGLIISMYD